MDIPTNDQVNVAYTFPLVMDPLVMDPLVMDPDNSANMDRKRARLVANSRLPYDHGTKPPCDIWMDYLVNLLSVPFSSIYQHFVERNVLAALGILSDSATVDRDSTG